MVSWSQLLLWNFSFRRLNSLRVARRILCKQVIPVNLLSFLRTSCRHASHWGLVKSTTSGWQRTYGIFLKQVSGDCFYFTNYCHILFLFFKIVPSLESIHSFLGAFDLSDWSCQWLFLSFCSFNIVSFQDFFCSVMCTFFHSGFESRLREVCEELLGPPHR